MSQRTILPQLEFWSLLLKGGGGVAGIADFLEECFVLAAL